MIPLIKIHLRQKRGFMIGWTIGVVGVITLIMMVYPSIRDQATQLNQALNQLPEGIRSLKSNSSDLLSPVGFMNSQLYYATLPLFFGIMAISLGSSLLARDEQDHTLELLLARPIKRSTILAAKAIAGVIVICGVAALSALDAVILSRVVGLEISVGHLLLATLYSVLLPLTFGAVAFALTCTSLARKASVGVAIFFGFGGYIISSMTGLVDWLETPSKIFPYHYYDSYGILNGHVPKGLTLYISIVLAASVLVSVIGFRRRDIE